MKFNPIIAANWKMYKTPSQGISFVKEVIGLCGDLKDILIIFGLPFTNINSVKVKPPFFKSAQNCHWEESGAFTGEISVSMIKDCGAEYIIVGHSERRHIFKENNSDINLKIRSILKGGLKPIFCVGETLEDRNNNQTEKVLENQLKLGLYNISSLDNIIIAYEPVWAIGTGLTADENQIESAHLKLREILLGLYPKSKDIPILYGGSVKPNNAKTIIQVPGVNGFLIGGASLDIDSFVSIIKIVKNI